MSQQAMVRAALEEQEKRKQTFFKEMRDFPCSFNVGNSDLTVGDRSYNGVGIDEPNMNLDKWKYLVEDLKDEEDCKYEDASWRGNLLTRALFESGEREEAVKLNKKIREKYNTNLVALANAAFLYLYNHDSNRAMEIVRELKQLKSQSCFHDLKLDAVCEQGYYYRKFGGAKNLLNSIAIFTFALPLRREDERLEFMLAMVYRRCTHFGVYSEDPGNIKQHDFALKAATNLFRLSTTAKSKTIKAASLIELAYLKYGDDKAVSCRDNLCLLLSTVQWKDIVGDKTWEQLCEDAIQCNDQSEKVLKMAGQLYRYCKTDLGLKKSVDCLMKSIEIKPTQRAHHHLGLTYREMAVNLEKKSSYPLMQKKSYTSNGEINSDLRVLPKPPPECIPQKLPKSLKFQTRAPWNLHKFNKDNPYMEKAIFHFSEAVRLSHKQNQPAIYDLAKMFVNLGKFTDAKLTCDILINSCISSEKIINDPLNLVNGYNLYSICCAFESEEALPERKQELQAESEEMLITSVRFASYLAASVPELATCVTDLWNAFSNLERKFKFDGRKESRNKLWKLLESVSDYRHLQMADDIFSQDSSVWENKNALEQCLKRYLNMNAVDSALLFWDMIQFNPKAANHKPKWRESESVQHLMFEVAKRSLVRSARQEHVSQPDTIWKHLLQEEFQTQNSKMYDIVIANDTGSAYEEDSQSVSDNISENLKKMLKNICGLRAVRAHEKVIPGYPFLEECINTIDNSVVAIFVLTNPSSVASSLESGFEKTLRISENGRGRGHLNNSHDMSDIAAAGDFHPTENAVANREQERGIHAISGGYELVINACVKSYIDECGAGSIIPVVGCQFGKEHLPQVLQGQLMLCLSDDDVQTLSFVAQGGCTEKSIQLIMKIFKTIVNKPEKKEST